MDKKDPKYESLKNKLLKLSKLADSGDTHEARNARFAIERLCSQYDISIEEITAEVQESKWYGFEVGRSKTMLNLFAQCYFHVTGENRLNYRQIPGRSKVEVSLTAFEYAELKSMFDWHQSNYKAEQKKLEDTLFQAYIHKHSLFGKSSNKDSDENEETELTPEILERIRQIIHMKQTLSDTHYHKLLEQ